MFPEYGLTVKELKGHAQCKLHAGGTQKHKEIKYGNELGMAQRMHPIWLHRKSHYLLVRVQQTLRKLNEHSYDQNSKRTALVLSIDHTFPHLNAATTSIHKACNFLILIKKISI